MATRGDLLGLVDPDVEDGRQRCFDAPDWAAIAKVMEEVGWKIVTGQLARDDDGDLVVIADDLLLGDAEVGIVRSWLYDNPDPVPRADPLGKVWNGRHRLWNCWAASPQATLPVLSEAVSYYPHIEGWDSEPEIVRLRTDGRIRATLDKSPMYRDALFGRLPNEDRVPRA